MKRIILSFILATLCGISAFAANNYDFSAMCVSGQTLYYKITSSTAPYTVKIVPQNSSSPYYSTYPISDLMIPSSVTYNGITYSVTQIGGYAFYGCSGLTSVTIPNSVTSIGNDAFYQCSGLTEVTIPNSITSIGSYAFYYCSGLSGALVIPNSVTSILLSTFSGCSGLTSITIPSSVTSIGTFAFSGCSGLTEVTIPNSVTSIGRSAFRNCSGLTSVTIGNSVTSIDVSVFEGCSGMTSITLGNSVTSIGISAFYGCTSLTEITIPNSVTSIDSCAFYGCSGLSGALVIPNSVTSIGQSAFLGCSSLTSLTLGNSVTSIGFRVFYGCTSLAEITIPNSVTSIDSCAFYGCSGLSGALVIPNSVTSIGGSAFYGCSGLSGALVIPNSVTSIGGSAFSGCSGLTSVTIPNSITSIAGRTFDYCSGLTSVTIPNSVTSIGESAFGDCSGLTSVTIPNSVTSIGNYAFWGCSGLTSITMGNGITNIGAFAFEECSGLTRVNYLGTIAQWCGIQFRGSTENPLYYAHNLYINNSLVTDLIIPNTVTEIKDRAFVGATCLTSVTIGNSVTRIGYYAFSNCSGLTSVSIPNSVTIIDSNAFTGCSGLASVTIPNSVTGIGYYAFAGCCGLTSVTIGNSVTLIRDGAFKNCSGLTVVNFNATNCTIMGSYSEPVFLDCNANATINIGDDVTIIPDYAFKGLLGGMLVIPNSVTSIGEYAFYGCRGLTNIYANPLTPPTIASTSFSNYSATLWVRCGFASTYSAANVWSNFSDIRESRAYMLRVSSDNPQQGTASVIEQPTTCTNATAVIGATPNRGYTFSQWNDGNTNNPRTVNVTTFVEYTASFTTMPSYTITAVSADENMGTVIGGGTYYEGETATLTATANDGYTFVSWTDGNTSNPRTITVTGDAAFTATFVGLHTITVSSDDTNMGTVSGGGTYTEGSLIEIMATPAVHHHFVHWNDGNTDNPRTITVTSDSTFTASFAIDQHTVTVVSADAEMGTVSEGGTYDYGTEIQISATPAEGYGFVAWNDGNNDNPRTIIVTEDITYTATFGALRTITIVSADETQGTIQGTGEYAEGTTIQITAIPNEHYHFEHWIDGENQTRDFNTDNPRTITVTGNMTYTAVFAIDQHTITVESADIAMGTVSEGGTYDYGTEMQISATASNGYQFVSWNDGNTDNPRTITVVADATYIASFASVVGIEESAVSEIALFPNPTTDILNITSSETISEIEIVNVMGQVVKRIEVNADNVVCDVEELKAGVYVVRIRTAKSDTSATLSQRRFVKE